MVAISYSDEIHMKHIMLFKLTIGLHYVMITDCLALAVADASILAGVQE